jgi:glycosyltransferase involved in cell wall biosynthesis
MDNNSNIKHQASNNATPKVAIVCDWLTNMGGAERVVLQLHRMFPDAPIYTSTYEKDKMPLFKKANVRTAWFQKLPKFLRKHQLLTIPRQWYFGHLKLRGYDVVISASGAEAKAVRAPDGVHINICYTPTLYYWIKPDNYLKGGTDSVNIVWRLGLKLLLPYAKYWDEKVSKRPDSMYAISSAVQDRIKKYYNRDTEILYPPADIERFVNDGTQARDGFVIFGRHVKHKRFDLAIKACNELQAKLTVIGDGPETKRLKALAGSSIVFRGRVPDDEMVNYISKAEAFIFPNEEDFGIVAVEAQAAGTPVIAYSAGGSLDTVIEGETGEFFDKQTVASLSNVLKSFNYKLYNRRTLLDNAERFSNEAFRQAVENSIHKEMR